MRCASLEPALYECDRSGTSTFRMLPRICVPARHAAYGAVASALKRLDNALASGGPFRVRCVFVPENRSYYVWISPLMWSGLPDSESCLICALLSAASDSVLFPVPGPARDRTPPPDQCLANRDFLFNLDIFIFNGRNRDPMTLEP